MKKLILLISLAVYKAYAQERILFTQCECLDNAFNVFDSVEVTGTMSLAGTPTCAAADSNGFPLDVGLLISDELSGITLSSNFMTGGFAIVFQLEIDSADFNTRILTFGTNSELRFNIRDEGIQLNDGEDNINVGVDFTGVITVMASFFVDNGQNSISICAEQDNDPTICVTESFSQGFSAVDDTVLVGSNVLGDQILIKQMDFFSDVSAFTQANDVAQADAIFAQVSAPVLVPGFNDQASITLTEDDVAVSVDLNGLVLGGLNTDLSFTLDDTANLGGTIDQTGFADSGVFTYSPALNFNGNEAFNFSYGLSSINCFNSDIASQLEITAVNDAPVAQDLAFDVVAAAPNPFTETVGSDVDAEGLTGATVTFTSGPQLSSADCSQDQNTFDVVDNDISFCFNTDAEFTEGTETVEFTLTDSDGGSDVGSIVFTGSIPVEATPDLVVVSGTEDGDAVVVELSNLGKSATFANNKFFIFIEDELNTGGGLEAEFVGVNLLANTSITFIPPTGAFNALNGAAVGADGEPIGDCAENERVGGFCPIGFTYSVRVNEFTTQTETFNFVINAFDNQGETFSLDEDSVSVEANNGDTSATASLPPITIASDNGESVFNVKLGITTTASTSVQLNPSISTNGLVIISNTVGVNGQTVDNCFNFQCQNVNIETTPNQMNTILAQLTVIIDLTEDLLASSVNFELTSGNGEIEDQATDEVSFDVSISELGFFDVAENVAYVGGGGAGVAILVIGLVVYRVRHGDTVKANNEITAAKAKVAADIKKGKLRAPPQKGSKRAKKNKTVAVSEEEVDDFEDLGQGWEKHYDTESQSHFFYNSKTDVTQWDMPAQLETRQDRIQTTELNI